MSGISFANAFGIMTHGPRPDARVSRAHLRTVPAPPRDWLAAMTRPAANDPPGMRLYAALVIAIGVCVLSVRVPAMTFEQPWLLLALTAGAIVLSTWKVPIPMGHGSATLSLSYFTDFLALVLLGADEAMLVAGASGAAQYFLMSRGRPKLSQATFNVAALVITMQVTGIAAQALGGFLTELDPDPRHGDHWRGHGVLPRQQLARGDGSGAVAAAADREDLVQQLLLDRAGVLHCRGERGSARAGRERLRLGGDPRGGAAARHAPRLSTVSGSPGGAAAPPRRSVGAPFRQRRGACPRHRCARSDNRSRPERREPHSARAGLGNGAGRSRGHEARTRSKR